jgi:hypothetical protein
MRSGICANPATIRKWREPRDLSYPGGSREANRAHRLQPADLDALRHSPGPAVDEHIQRGLRPPESSFDHAPRLCPRSELNAHKPGVKAASVIGQHNMVLDRVQGGFAVA